MSDEQHKGCRVCGRVDVGLKKDGTLRMHVRPDRKGRPFLGPVSSRCHGAGGPPKGVLGNYAQRVVANLLPHFPDLKDPVVATVIGEAVQRHHTSPDETFEAILDGSANWRLKPDGRDTGRVRLSCYRLYERDEDSALEKQVNAALSEIHYR